MNSDPMYTFFFLVTFLLFLFLFFDRPEWCLDRQNLVLVQSNDHPTVCGLCMVGYLSAHHHQNSVGGCGLSWRIPRAVANWWLYVGLHCIYYFPPFSKGAIWSYSTILLCYFAIKPFYVYSKNLRVRAYFFKVWQRRFLLSFG